MSKKIIYKNTLSGGLARDRVDLSFNNDLNSQSESTEKFNKQISIKISSPTYLQWKEAKKRIKDVCGYDNESKVFEFMLIEFLNIPLKSYE